MHVLIVGLGNMGMKYLAKLEILQELPVACDIDPYKNPKRFPFYCHFGDVKEDLKGVIVATDPKNHVSIAEKFLKEGIPVLLEKPPALKTSEFSKIVDHPLLEISEVELYSFPVRNFPKSLSVKEILIERLNKGRGYINPLWDLAWHDLYILQYLFGIPKVEKVKDGRVWEIEGHVKGIPFKLRVAWEYEKGPKRAWTLITDRGKVLLDFLEEKLTIDGHTLGGKRTDKLLMMVKDFLEGKKRKGSTKRAMVNIQILESLNSS